MYGPQLGYHFGLTVTVDRLALALAIHPTEVGRSHPQAVTAPRVDRALTIAAPLTLRLARPLHCHCLVRRCLHVLPPYLSSTAFARGLGRRRLAGPPVRVSPNPRHNRRSIPQPAHGEFGQWF